MVGLITGKKFSLIIELPCLCKYLLLVTGADLPEYLLRMRTMPVADCTDIDLNARSGVYPILINSLGGREYQVFCDMGTAGGGWTVGA